MIVALGSRTASPGVTTLAALLAANWDDPDATRLIVEADPAGGTLAARWSVAHGVTWDPGLLDLSTKRSDLGRPETIAAIGQPLADDLWLTAAPPAPEQVRAALTRMGDAGAAALAATPGLAAFADCGRLTFRSPALPLAQRAVLTLLVCRPHLEEVYAVAPAVDELRDAGCNVMLLCVGDRPYDPAEVSRALGIELMGVVPDDVRAANELRRNGLAAGRAYRRSQLARSLRELTSLVRARCSELLHPMEVTLPRSEPSAVSLDPEPATVGATAGAGDETRPVPPQPPVNPAMTGDVPRSIQLADGNGSRPVPPQPPPSPEHQGNGATTPSVERWLPPSGAGRD